MVDQGFVGELEGAVESVREEFTAEIGDEFVLAMQADEDFKADKAIALKAAGKGDGGIDGAAGEVFGAGIAHRTVPFESETE